MKIETKYNVGDKVIFDGDRAGEIVGFEIHSTMKEPGYKKPNYPQYANNTQVRYQIKPTDSKEDIYPYGSMRNESELTLITD